ncbi:Uncharacterized oxidoreductase [hydrothermal vent metagenome]|uniref:Uncharacterized oxidoreductase n=1 Tax=hydrothermal vent metagenome TaxID=652676 RepID=A0A3B0TKQ6_9ZZZZ
MATTERTVYIAGAGIAGLTLALALARFELKIVVLERTQTIEVEGAGLQISPNARRVLDRLGLSEALDKMGFEPQGIDIYPFRCPSPIVTLELGEAARQQFMAPYCVIHRADLAQALFSACKRFANIDIQFGIANFDLVTHARGLSLSVDKASGGQHHDARPHAFVGADGVNSPTRTKILGGPEARYSGFCAWRAMVPISTMANTLNLDNTSLLWAPGFHLVAYPHPIRKQVNIVLATKEKLAAITQSSLRKKSFLRKKPSLPNMMLKSKIIEDIIATVGNGWKMWPLNAVTSDKWHQGPVGLIGDAAHAMLPFQAQGAAMAIEDAAILAPLLASDLKADAAFERYESLRKKRVERVARLSARNASFYHMEWPFSLTRDTVISAQGPKAHFERLGWIYNYDSEAALNKSAPLP